MLSERIKGAEEKEGSRRERSLRAFGEIYKRSEWVLRSVGAGEEREEEGRRRDEQS